MIRHYFFFFFFFWLPAFLTTAQPAVVDSLQKQLEVHQKADTTLVNVYNLLSEQYQWIDFEKSLLYAEQAQKLSLDLGFYRGIATAYLRRAHCLWALGDSDRAIEKGLKAVSIADVFGYLNVKAEAYRMLARSYRDQQEIDKALSYIRQAENLAKAERNWDLLARIYNLAGVIECSRDRSDSAYYYYNKALDVTAEHSTTKFHVSQVLSNIGEMFLRTNTDKALSYFTRALASAKETSNRLAEAGINGDIGRAYILKKRYRDADKFLNESLRLARQLKLKRVIRYAYTALVELRIQQGKTSEALKYMQASYDVRDSLMNGSKTRQIVELETRFEAEKQRQKIALLEQEKRIQSLWSNVLIVGSVLLLTALIAIYRLQKLRSAKARQLLETQKALNDKLKETDTLKSRFFANLSHEFRTPLSLILGPVEQQLQNRSIDEAERRRLVLIQRNANSLLNLVNQLLDLSKLDAGKMELMIAGGDLVAFVDLLTASFESLAEHKQISFFKKISPFERPAGFDSDKIEKIVTNILFNAFKFTPPGGTVTFSFAIHQNQIRISVADTGKGIPREDLPHVFSPFYQAKHSNEEGSIGTGLGLSLVSELVSLYKGKIKLASEVDSGTCITVLLPLFEAAEAKPIINNLPVNLLSTINLHEKEKCIGVSPAVENTVLIVEDNTALRAFIASGLHDRFNVLTASNGDQGFAMAVTHLPDVIISDVMMPGINGLELATKIKDEEKTSHIPVILLTARADNESKLEALSKRVDDYLSKPFSMEELRLRITNLIDQRKRMAAKLRAEFSDLKVIKNSEPSMEEKFMMKVQAVIENNLGNPRFGVEMLAEEMSLSRAQLFRKLKALVNTSPRDLINDIRLKRAAELILAKADNVAQIGYSVGFNEQSYFAKRFRKKYGVSPTEYSK